MSRMYPSAPIYLVCTTFPWLFSYLQVSLGRHANALSDGNTARCDSLNQSLRHPPYAPMPQSSEPRIRILTVFITGRKSPAATHTRGTRSLVREMLLSRAR